MATEKKRPSFAQFEENLQMLFESAEELDSPDLDEATKQEVSAMFDELGVEEKTYADGFHQFCKIKQARIKAIEEEIAALQRSKKAEENRLKWVKSCYLATFDKAGMTKLKGNAHTLYVQERPKAVVPANVMDIPEEYQRVKIEREADKEKILAALQAGVVINGCSLGKSRWLASR